MTLPLLLALWACGDGSGPDGTDGGAAQDGGGAGDGGGSLDGGSADGGSADGGSADGGSGDGGAAADCGLVSDLATPWFTEGDHVGFHVACTGTLPTEAAEITPLDLPAGATWDPVARSVGWHTGPADGGRYDLSFAIRPVDAPGGVPEAGQVTFWVADDPLLPGAEPVDPLAYTEEWGLPVLHVRASSAIGTEYVPATVSWQGEALPATIKIRGASSASYTKPSYTLEFDVEEIAVPWGDETRDHLVLLTTFDDNSYVRQKLVYDQWAAIADYWGEDRLTPRSFFVVVYLDGAYHGLYVGMDRIDDEFVRQMGLTDGGNLFKAVNHDANFYLTDAYGSPKHSLAQGYTKEEGEPVDDVADLEALVGFTGGATDDEILAGLDDWLPTGEYMDWLLLVHYCLGEDSAGKNSYHYHDPDTGQFRYAPWDFNHAWGQGWYTYRISSSTIDDYLWTNRIFAAFQRDPTASAALWDRFRAMRADGPFQTDWLLAQLDAYTAEIAPSAARDWAHWAEAYRSYPGWAGARNAAGDWTDYEGETAYLRTWIEERGALYEERVP